MNEGGKRKKRRKEANLSSITIEYQPTQSALNSKKEDYTL